MSKSLVLRSSKANGTSNNKRLKDGVAITAEPFQWPTSGPVECMDWDERPVCGGGLHGLLWGEGDWSLLCSDEDAVWQVIEVDTESIVKIDESKVKFQRGIFVYSGNMAKAMSMVMTNRQRTLDMIEAFKREALTSDANNASSGDSAKNASSGHYATNIAKGKDSVCVAAGLNSIMQAGPNGCFAATWYDESSNRNRILVAYVGEDGIKPNVSYKIANGKWIEV